MSDKPTSDSNHREIVSLREYFDRRLTDVEDKIQLEFELSQKAIEKAETVTNLSIRAIWSVICVIIVALIAAVITHILKS